MTCSNISQCSLNSGKMSPSFPPCRRAAGLSSLSQTPKKAIAPTYSQRSLTCKTARHVPLVIAAAGSPKRKVPWAGTNGMQQYLLDNRAKQLPIQEILTQQKEGRIILDIREEKDFQEVRAEGAVNLPLFGPITGMEVGKIMKRLVFATNGMEGTEMKEDFIETVESRFPDKSTPLAVMCIAGGTYMATFTSGLEAKKSRSLIAMYKLLEEGGYTDVVHVQDGLRAWASEGLPMEGDDVEAWKDQASTVP